MRLIDTLKAFSGPAALFGATAAMAISASAVELRLAHVDPAEWQSSKKGAAALIFQQLVQAESEGEITVSLFPASQLGGEVDLLQSVQDGQLQMAMVSGAFTQFCAEAAVLDTPYIFPSAPVAWSVLDGEFGRNLAEHCLEETGMRTLAYGETGYRHFTNSVRPIRTPADMEGLSFRVQTIPLYVEMVNALGAEPTPIDWPEVPTALATGVVDGQENPIGVIYGNGFQEFQDYMVLDQHVYGTDFLVINDDMFQGLSENHQAIIKRNAIVAGTMGRAIQQFTSAEGLGKLIDEGMEVAVPTADELRQFQEAAQPAVLDWLRTQVDEQWITDLQDAVAEAEATL